MKGILALPIMIEVGKLWRLLVVFEVASMSSVTLGLLAVLYVFMSLIHNFIL